MTCFFCGTPFSSAHDKAAHYLKAHKEFSGRDMKFKEEIPGALSVSLEAFDARMAHEHRLQAKERGIDL